MQKEQYEAPEMEIVVFETEDVITTSPGGNQQGNDVEDP